MISHNHRQLNLQQTQASLRNTILGATGSGMGHIRSARFVDAYMWGADLSGSLMTGTCFYDMCPPGADFTRANLTGASLLGAQTRTFGYGAPLTNAIFTGAILVGTLCPESGC